jgi:hypothetical protein
MRTIAVVGCSKGKLSYPEGQAQFLYFSDLFHLSHRYAERFCTNWIILSAFYGVLYPTDVIQPYNLSLRDFNAKQMAEWRARCRPVLKRLQAEEPTCFVVLAGGLYFSAVWEVEQREGHILVPMAGLGIGQRVAWLNKELANPFPKKAGDDGR